MVTPSHDLRLHAKMALSILLLLLLPQIEGQSTVQRTVVEGLSTNIEIPCSLDRHLHPLYWNITDKVYELFSVPAVFTARSPDAITLASISRRMDGWGLYCFAIDPTNENGVIAGVTTVLNVLHGTSDSVCLSVGLSVCLSVCLPVCLCLSVCTKTHIVRACISCRNWLRRSKWFI